MGLHSLSSGNAMHEKAIRSQDFAQYVPYQLTSTSDHLGWGGFRVEIVRDHSAGEVSLPSIDHHLLNLIVSVPTSHEHRWDGMHRDEIGREGSASLVPAGAESYWRWNYVEEGSPCDLHLHLDPAFVRRVAVANLDELPKDFEFQSELCFYNPTLHRIARILLTEVEDCGLHGALFAESLATALIALLLKAQQPYRAALPSPSRAQATDRIRVVCEYIEGNLGADLHLEQLGRIAGLGPDRFGELFRTSTGVSPYRYVLQRKIERAKAMLLRREIPIAQIALDLGFADHAHLSSTFRRLTGTMPSRFRSEAVR